MSPPRVSICVPNLNTRPFLGERFETIFQQSFQDWELLVYDGYSEDGAWEYIRSLAEREPRMRVWQGPREGTPGSWTPCVRQATGEYVYIATSDDTMAPNCLEKLVAALDKHPECDLAHCPLKAIDETGCEASDWWSLQSTFALSSGDLLFREHIRNAPFDGLLHLLGETVYTSITQLLIRRSVFDRIGFFESKWGPAGDFVWSMRAGLAANVIHVPDTWGGWRLHSGQATESSAFGSYEHSRKVEDMIQNVLMSCEKFLLPQVSKRLVSGWSKRGRELRNFRAGMQRTQSISDRRVFVLQRLLAGSRAARGHCMSRLREGRAQPDWAHRVIKNWLKDISIQSALVPV